jgi:hypothetical protein
MSHDRLVPAHVKYLAFSLSKSHNVADFRIGWLMTKEPLQPQHLVQYDHEYGPSRHAEVLRMAINFAPNYLYRKYKDHLSELYAKHKLEEPHTNLFALDARGIRVPYWTLLQNP